MKKVMERVISKLTPEQQSDIIKTTIGDDEVYIISIVGMVQVYAGIKDNNLIMSIGKPMFEKALAGSVSSGFLTNLKDRSLAKTLSADINTVYLDFGEILKAMKNFKALTRHLNKGKPNGFRIEEIVNQFEYLLSTSRYENGVIYSDLVVKTKFSESFFQGVGKIVKQFQDTDS